MSETNPYAAPAATGEASHTVEGAEQERREHLTAEADIKVIGLHNYLTGALLCWMIWVQQTRAHGSSFDRGDTAVRGIVAALVAVGLVLLGRQVRAFGQTARVIQTLYLGCAAVMSCGMAIVVVAPAVFFLWSTRASTVFSLRYQNIIVPATPQLKPRVSVLWLLLLPIGVLPLIPAMNFLVYGAPVLD